MPGLIIDNKEVLVPGLTVTNWLDKPGLHIRINQKYDGGRLRKTSWIRMIILHTTKGIPGGKDKREQKIIPGYGKNNDIARKIVENVWRNQNKSGGFHLICDHDGSWHCFADLSKQATYHATSVNEYSIGIELYQGNDAELYEGQLMSCIKMLDFLTQYFSIQRQIHLPYQGPIERLSSGGIDCVGVFGHRDQTNRRGEGDPGNEIMRLLSRNGYEQFDFNTDLDKEIWKIRQNKINVRIKKEKDKIKVDGVPGPKTINAIKKLKMNEYGLWSEGKENKKKEKKSIVEIIINVLKSIFGG